MNPELTHTGLPVWAAEALGIEPRSQDEQFNAVISAFAHSHRRHKPPTPEQMAELKRAAKRNDPRHMKALAKRRKRKRGGPK